MNSKNRNEFVAGVIYKSAMEDEKEWRREKKNKHDVVICDRLIKEVRDLGYNYHYLVDLTNRKNDDQELLDNVKRQGHRSCSAESDKANAKEKEVVWRKIFGSLKTG